MSEKIRYRLKISVPATGILKTILGIFPNALVFVAYDLSQSVLSNVALANGVLDPFGVSIDISQG